MPSENMQISDATIAIFMAAAEEEVFTAGLPFPVHLDAIERLFARLEKRSDIGFVVHSRSRDDDSGCAIYKTSLGDFILTPEKGELVILGPGDEIEQIPFFSKTPTTDRTTSLVSAALRMAGRRLADMKGDARSGPA